MESDTFCTTNKIFKIFKIYEDIYKVSQVKPSKILRSDAKYLVTQSNNNGVNASSPTIPTKGRTSKYKTEDAGGIKGLVD